MLIRDDAILQPNGIPKNENAKKQRFNENDGVLSNIDHSPSPRLLIKNQRISSFEELKEKAVASREYLMARVCCVPSIRSQYPDYIQSETLMPSNQIKIQFIQRFFAITVSCIFGFRRILSD